MATYYPVPERIDNSKYDYTQPIAAYPNLYLQVPKGSTHPRWVAPVLHPELDELVQQLLKRLPKWKLVATDTHMMRDDTYQLRAFLVMHPSDSKQPMGRVIYDYHASRPYALTSRRIADERNRGNVARTSKPEKAAKIIEEKFIPYSVAEYAPQGVGFLHSKVGSDYMDAERRQAALFMSLIELLKPALQAMDAPLLAALPPRGRQIHADWMEQQRSTNEIAHVRAKLAEQGAVHVTIQHDACVVVSNRGGFVNMGTIIQGPCDIKDLPDHLQIGIAMLRLSPPKSLIPGVGVRMPGVAETDNFFVLPPA